MAQSPRKKTVVAAKKTVTTVQRRVSGMALGGGQAAPRRGPGGAAAAAGKAPRKTTGGKTRRKWPLASSWCWTRISPGWTQGTIVTGPAVAHASRRGDTPGRGRPETLLRVLEQATDASRVRLCSRPSRTSRPTGSSKTSPFPTRHGRAARDSILPEEYELVAAATTLCAIGRSSSSSSTARFAAGSPVGPFFFSLTRLARCL